MAERQKLILLQVGFASLIAFNVGIRFWAGAVGIFSFQLFYLLLQIYFKVSGVAASPEANANILRSK